MLSSNVCLKIVQCTHVNKINKSLKKTVKERKKERERKEGRKAGGFLSSRPAWVYRVSSSTARDTQRNPVSKNQTNKQV